MLTAIVYGDALCLFSGCSTDAAVCYLNGKIAQSLGSTSSSHLSLCNRSTTFLAIVLLLLDCLHVDSG